MRLDLHIHSTASDGAWHPREVVRGAVGRLDVVALADHDTAAGVPAALDEAGDLPLDVIPATELSSTWKGRDIHVLGYFVDPASPAFRRHAERARLLRHDRLMAMVGRLADQDVDVPVDRVLAAAGPGASSLGRPHLARALVEAGHASSVPDAFNRLIGDEHPAFIPTRLGTPVEAVEVILEAGGVPVWAHPPLDALDALLPSLLDAGLRGLEVFRPRSHPDAVRRLESAANRAGLVVTGGSDWHTPDAGSELGDFHVRAEEVADFLELGGM